MISKRLLLIQPRALPIISKEVRKAGLLTESEPLMEPVGKRYNKRQFKNSLQTAKELIEAEAKAAIEA